MSSFKKFIENILPSLCLIVGLIVYDQYYREKGAPAAPAPDPAVVKLGGDYSKALQEAAASTLDGTAQGSWNSTSDAVSQNRKQFQTKLEDAFKPIAGELTRRFGPVSDQPTTPAMTAAFRAFCHDLAEGVRKGGK